jgi:hypothetical protein
MRHSLCLRRLQYGYGRHPIRSRGRFAKKKSRPRSFSGVFPFFQITTLYIREYSLNPICALDMKHLACVVQKMLIAGLPEGRTPDSRSAVAGA